MMMKLSMANGHQSHLLPPTFIRTFLRTESNGEHRRHSPTKKKRQNQKSDHGADRAFFLHIFRRNQFRSIDASGSISDSGKSHDFSGECRLSQPQTKPTFVEPCRAAKLPLRGVKIHRRPAVCGRRANSHHVIYYTIYTNANG